jgi:hypothetical protein
MLQVFRAFDRKPLAEVPVDDAAAMEAKLQTAVSVFKDRDRWLAPHERTSLLRRAAALLGCAPTGEYWSHVHVGGASPPPPKPRLGVKPAAQGTDVRIPFSCA